MDGFLKEIDDDNTWIMADMVGAKRLSKRLDDFCIACKGLQRGSEAELQLQQSARAIVAEAAAVRDAIFDTPGQGIPCILITEVRFVPALSSS